MGILATTQLNLSKLKLSRNTQGLYILKFCDNMSSQCFYIIYKALTSKEKMNTGKVITCMIPLEKIFYLLIIALKS